MESSSTTSSSYCCDITHKWISESVAYYNMIKETVSRHHRILHDVTNELKTLLNQPQIGNMWASFLNSFTTDISSCCSMNDIPCSILVCGLVKAGKSSLVNDFLRDEIRLPSDDFLATLRFTVVKYGERSIARRVLNGKILEEEEFEDCEPPETFIKGNSAEERRQGDSALRQHVEVDVNCELLKSGLRIIDTPGLDEDQQINKIFYDLSKEFRPTVVIFVFDALVGFGGNVVKYSDNLLHSLNSLKYPYSIMFVANKINGNDEADERDRKPKNKVGFQFHRHIYMETIQKNFPQFVEKIKIHGTSPVVMEAYRNGEPTQDKWHIVQFHMEFEMDIAEKVKEAALEIIEEIVMLVEPLCHDLGKLSSSITQHHQELQVERCILLKKGLPDKLKSLHDNLLCNFIQQFKVNWDPNLNYRRDLYNLCKTESDSILLEEHVHKTMEYLVDRAVNIMANIISKLFLSPNRKEQFTSFTDVCQQYLPMSACHKYCIMELLVKQDKLLTIRQKCVCLMQEKIPVDQSMHLTLEMFIAKLCSASLCLPIEIGNFLKEKLFEEIENLNENIHLGSMAISHTENQLDISLEKLNSLKTKVAVVHSELLSMKTKQPKIELNPAHFPNNCN